MGFSIRHAALLVMTLALCFGVGFSFEAYPRFWDQVFHRTERKTVVLLVFDQQSLPAYLTTDFADQTGYLLDIHEAKTLDEFTAQANSANLLYASWEWLEKIKPQLRPWNEQFWSQLFSDFQSNELFEQKFFPLLWSLQVQPAAKDPKAQFTFEGFASTKNLSEATQTFLHFLLGHEDQLKTWTFSKHKGSTLQQATSWKDFPESLKPQALRNQAFTDLSAKKETAKPTGGDSGVKSSSKK